MNILVYQNNTKLQKDLHTYYYPCLIIDTSSSKYLNSLMALMLNPAYLRTLYQRGDELP